MATYSTNLGLTLLTTGEGAGTWGNTTNTNLGTLLEQSISGYVTESLTAGTTLTLTIPNGTTGVARNMYIEFTGNGSTVLVPSNKKLYFVYNNCSSGTISFKVAGQTGVSVPKGDKKILVSNGTDIVEATSYISGSASSLTVTNLNVTSATITTIAGTSANITTLSSTSLTVNTKTYIGTTSDLGSLTARLYVSNGGTVLNGTSVFESTEQPRPCLFVANTANSGDNGLIAFNTDSGYTARGSITYNRGAGQVAYNTTSDRRAKTISGPVTNSGQIVDQLKVYSGRMNWGTIEYPMMIADEAQQTTPYCVTGQPNAVDEKGNPVYQQIDYSALVPLLLAEIQSLRARVAALEATP